MLRRSKLIRHENHEEFHSNIRRELLSNYYHFYSITGKSNK